MYPHTCSSVSFSGRPGARNWAAVGSAYLSPALGGPHPATSGRVAGPTEHPSQQGGYAGDTFSAFDPHPPTPAKPKASHNSGGRLNTTTTSSSGANGLSSGAFVLQAQRHPAAEFATSYLQAGGVGMGRTDHSGAATLLLDNHRANSSRNSKNPVHAVYGVQRASSASRANAHHTTGSPARQARRKWQPFQTQWFLGLTQECLIASEGCRFHLGGQCTVFGFPEAEQGGVLTIGTDQLCIALKC